MARFFQTSEGGSIDFMKQLPIELMMKGVQTADAANDQIFGQTDLLGNTVAKVNHLMPDSERVAQIQKSYTDEIDSVTNSLLANPADYRKQMPLVRNLTRKLSTDMQSGELAAIQGNANKLTEWDKTYKPMVAAGKITPDAYRIMKSQFLNDYTKKGGIKYDSTTGTYQQINTEDMYETQDFNKILQDTMKGIKANAKSVKNTSNGGQWLVTNQGKEEWVDANRVAQIASDTLMGDEKVKGYLRQGGKYGYLRGVTDPNGSFIEPYKLDDKGNPVFNMNSILAPSIRAAVGINAFKKSETESDIKANPYAVIATNFANDMSKMSTKRSNDRDDFVFEEAIKHANQKDIIQLRAAEATKSKTAVEAAKANITGKAAKPKAGDPTNPIALKDNQDLSLSWNPGGTNNKITNDKLMSDIASDKTNALANRAKAMDMNNGLSSDERSVYMANALAAEASYRKKGELAYIARETVNEKLRKQGFSDSDLKQLNGIGAKINNIDSQIQELTKNYGAVNSGGVGAPGINIPNPNQRRVDSLVDQKQYLTKIHDADSKLMSTWFKDNQDKTAFEIEGAGASVDQQKEIFKMLSETPNLFKPKNMKGQNFDDYLQTAPISAKRSTQMSFPTLSTDINQMMKDFEILTVNAPTAGMPASITVKTKPKDGFLLDNRGDKDLQTYIIPIHGNMQKVLGNQMAKSKDVKKQSVGNLINDFSISTAIAELNDRIINYDSEGQNPIGHASLPTITFKDKSRFTPDLVVIPQKTTTNSSSGDLGVYRAKISLPNGAYKELGNVATIEDAVHKAFDMFRSEEDKK